MGSLERPGVPPTEHFQKNIIVSSSIIIVSWAQICFATHIACYIYVRQRDFGPHVVSRKK